MLPVHLHFTERQIFWHFPRKSVTMGRGCGAVVRALAWYGEVVVLQEQEQEQDGSQTMDALPQQTHQPTGRMSSNIKPQSNYLTAHFKTTSQTSNANR